MDRIPWRHSDLWLCRVPGSYRAADLGLCLALRSPLSRRNFIGGVEFGPPGMVDDLDHAYGRRCGGICADRPHGRRDTLPVAHRQPRCQAPSASRNSSWYIGSGCLRLLGLRLENVGRRTECRQPSESQGGRQRRMYRNLHRAQVSWRPPSFRGDVRPARTRRRQQGLPTCA